MTRAPKVAFGIGGVLLVAAVVWWLVAIPALVKYPTDVNVSPQYAGTFTLYVDPTSAAPLATPTQLPLTVDRQIKAVGSESGSSHVLVQETIVEKAGDLVNTTQTNAYVMDRSSVQNVADQRAYAFDPSNVVDRSPAYRLNLPFATSATGSYDIYKNEIASTYQLRQNTTEKTTSVSGMTLDNFQAAVTDAPLSAAYLAELRKSVPLPETLTLDQLKPQLKQLGVDVDALLAALTPSLSSADLGTLAQIAAKPIPMQYTLSFEGHASVEPTTGAEVVVSSKETVGAKPQMADLPALIEVLGHYPQVPEATAAATALAKVQAAPSTPLFTADYAQTPSSVTAVASTVKDQRNKVDLVEHKVPVGLFGAGVIAFVIGGLLWWRRREPKTGAPVDLRSGTDAERVTVEAAP